MIFELMPPKKFPVISNNLVISRNKDGVIRAIDEFGNKVGSVYPTFDREFNFEMPYDETGTAYCTISSLFVEEQYRNRGIGRKLMQECIEYAKRRKAAYALLNVFRQNRIAINLYKSLGFRTYQRGEFFNYMRLNIDNRKVIMVKYRA